MTVNVSGKVIKGTRIGNYEIIRVKGIPSAESCVTRIPNDSEDVVFRMKLNHIGLEILEYDDEFINVRLPMNWKHIIAKGSHYSHHDNTNGQFIMDDKDRPRIAIDSYEHKIFLLTRYNYGINIVTRDTKDKPEFLTAVIYFTDTYHRFDNTEVKLSQEDFSEPFFKTDENGQSVINPEIHKGINKAAEELLESIFPQWKSPFIYWE